MRAASIPIGSGAPGAQLFGRRSFLLEPTIIPENPTGPAMASSRLLDDGDEQRRDAYGMDEARGFAGAVPLGTNGPNKHLMVEVIYTQSLKNVSRGRGHHALSPASNGSTQRRQAGKKPEPTMSRNAGDHTTLYRIVAGIEKAIPDVANKARKAAEAQIRGEPDAEFRRFSQRLPWRSSGRWRRRRDDDANAAPWHKKYTISQARPSGPRVIRQESPFSV